MKKIGLLISALVILATSCNSTQDDPTAHFDRLEKIILEKTTEKKLIQGLPTYFYAAPDKSFVASLMVTGKDDKLILIRKNISDTEVNMILMTNKGDFNSVKTNPEGKPENVAMEFVSLFTDSTSRISNEEVFDVINCVQ